MNRDLHGLPRVRDSLSYLYVEHAKVDQTRTAIALHDEQGTVEVPCASLTTLLLGPGTSVTHAAMRTLAEHGCGVVWTGEEGVRCYAQGLGETRSSRNLLVQARRWASAADRLAVVRRMYEQRFSDPLPPGLTLQQIRGMEGARVRVAYLEASAETGVPWEGRNYDRGGWGRADPVNRALSSANACLYGVCHAAIVAAGYSPGLGFIHTGKQLSFVYDVADLYKTELSVRVAFRVVADGTQQVETRVRRAMREAFHQFRLLGRIVDEIGEVLGVGSEPEAGEEAELASDAARPGGLWDPDGETEGGVNYGDKEAEQ